jgi:serpin B
MEKPAMNHYTLIAAALATLLLGLAGTAAAQQSDLSPDSAALVKGDNAFALSLYNQLSHDDGNLFFSPYSISNALAMTYAGARGKTADDMAKALHFPVTGNQLHAAFAGVVQDLDRKGQQRKYQLSIANRLWGQKGYGFLPEFLKLSKDAYKAGLQELDFASATEQARTTINDWVAKETQDKIKDLLPAGSLASDTRLVLTNAIYFKASWQEAFPPKATQKEDFKVGEGKTVKADMMHTSEVFRLTQNDALQMLELPYEQRELSMLVLLPRKADGLPQVEKLLSADNLEKWRKELKDHQVTVSLPKFKFTSEFKLKKVLSDLGMGIAFSKQADFSGMTTREQLFIDSVIHKAFVAVDEKGTEAAAATAVTMRPTAIQDVAKADFRADHPFVFVIRDNRTGSILFMGRVTQP